MGSESPIPRGDSETKSPAPESHEGVGAINETAMAQWKQRTRRSTGRALRTAARVFGGNIPLTMRQSMVEWLGHRRVPGTFQLSLGLLDDLRRDDPSTFHRFLWSKHLAYAESYEVGIRFNAANLNPTRQLLFNELAEYFRATGANAAESVDSVCEVGCSMGYLLRHLETEAYPAAAVLHGIDVDRYAIQAGNEHLRTLQSKVQLFAGDVTNALGALNGRVYDIVLCCGVLMYVNESAAEAAVRDLLSMTRRITGIICLADPASRKSHQGPSVMRDSDCAFLHDAEAMIIRAGGSVVSSKWIDPGESRGNPSQVILAEPPRH